jgi:hypothetical protein
VAKLPEKGHLDDLLDAALAGTFPASDPTSSFVCERERPPSAETSSQDAAPRRSGKRNSD